MNASHRFPVWLLAISTVVYGLGCSPTAGAPQAAPAAQPPAAAAQSTAAPAPPAASGQSQAGTALQALVDAARREGQLTLVWSALTLGGSEGAAHLASGFNRLYGLNVNVQFTPGLNMAEMAPRLVQEQQAGRPATTDVYIGPARPLVTLMDADAVEPVDWASWASNIHDSRMLAPNGVGVEAAPFLVGITYHSGKLTGSAVPTSMEDLLKPEFKGRIASTPYAANFDYLASPALWGERRTLDYVTRFADQVSGLIRCGEGDRLVTGEFDVFAIDCGTWEALRLQAKGAPVAQVVPRDAALMFYWYLAVPRNAAHPAAAKLFINYLLGREGQDYVYETHFADHPLVPGSKTIADIEKARATGAQITTIDVAFYQRSDNKDLDRVAGEVVRVLQQR